MEPSGSFKEKLQPDIYEKNFHQNFDYLHFKSTPNQKISPLQFFSNHAAYDK